MNILVCPDKFKGSLSAREVCLAVREGLLSARPDATIQTVPLADGGEGTCDLLTEWYQGDQVMIEVRGPLFRPVSARYGISRDGTIAFVEMAAASGLTLIPPEERNPLFTTTIGTGEMIADALSRNVRTVILGIGGSATNDAGIGMATALGYSFCDEDGNPLKPTGENLVHIRQIRTDSVNPLLKRTRFITLCDVQNPLYGPDGAAYVYGPQKGAGKSAIALLDAGLQNFERMAKEHLNCPVDFPGAGAAGGLGAGSKAFLQATMEKGVNFVIRNTNLTEKMKEADLIITGEGKIDRQTFSGKVVSEVVRLAQQAGKPVVALCGISELPETEIRTKGLMRILSLVDDQTSSETAIQCAARLIPGKVSKLMMELPDF